MEPTLDRKLKRKRAGRLGTRAMKVPVNNMSMADKFRLEQRRRLMNKRRDNLPGGMLTGGQAKIAAKAPPPNKIDSKDFDVLRKEKAKGRGQGLQDEKMKPGKVKKAVVGILAKGAKKILGRKRSATAKPQDVTMKGRGSGMGSMLVELFKKQKLGTPGIAGPVMRRGGIMKADKGGMGEATKYKKYLKGLKDVKDKTDLKKSKFIQRRMQLGGAKALEAAKATRIGKIAAGVAGAALLGKAALEKMYEKRTGKKPFTKRPAKKMGGGMMQRPIMASKGKSIKVKCKLGRNKPTKMY